MRSRWFLPALALCLGTTLTAQVIDFESNGLHYKTLTRNDVQRGGASCTRLMKTSATPLSRVYLSANRTRK